MAVITFGDGKKVGAGQKPYYVAEMNSSHNGKIELAKEMIDAALEAGCDAVKFQSWTADTLYSVNHYRENPIAKRMVSRFSLSEAALEELACYCKEKGIAFSSTPYSRPEVDFLARDNRASFIKVASMDLNNILFLKYIAAKGMPVVLSTGMGTEEEIEAAVRAIESEGNRKICILHCVSVYPVDASNVNLNNMRMLAEKYPEYVVGYSDHTIGCEVACAAVGMGAALVEKHFTLDNSKIGWDNQMATEPADMKKLTESCTNVFLSLGQYHRSVSEEEKQQAVKMRRSMVADHALEKGHVLTLADLDASRPGIGVPPDRYEQMLGKKLNRNVESHEIIFMEDLYD